MQNFYSIKYLLILGLPAQFQVLCVRHRDPDKLKMMSAAEKQRSSLESRVCPLHPPHYVTHWSRCLSHSMCPFKLTCSTCTSFSDCCACSGQFSVCFISLSCLIYRSYLRFVDGDKVSGLIGRGKCQRVICPLVCSVFLPNLY